jgi:hypothetical protein
MAYTTPATAVTGSKMNPEFWNTNVRDNTTHIYTQGTVTDASFSSVSSSFDQKNNIIEDLVLTPIVNLGTAVAGNNYTISYSQVRSMLLIEGGTAGTVVIPADHLTSGGTFSIGESISIAQIGTGQITVTGMASAVPNGTVALNYTPSNILRTQYSVASITKTGTNEWLLMGDLY